MKVDFKKLLLSMALPVLLGFAGYLLGGSTHVYETLEQPPFAPPAGVFSPVWAVLYLLMGWSSYRIAAAVINPEEKKSALTLYGLFLIFLNLWPWVFFRLELYFPAWILLMLLLVAGIRLKKQFGSLDALAGRLLLPLVLWLGFAAYLNLGVWYLNR